MRGMVAFVDRSNARTHPETTALSEDRTWAEKHIQRPEVPPRDPQPFKTAVPPRKRNRIMQSVKKMGSKVSKCLGLKQVNMKGVFLWIPQLFTRKKK